MMLFFCSNPDYIQGQDSLTWYSRGYVKDMITMIFPGEHAALMDNLVHHRWQGEIRHSRGLSFQFGMRNRIFTGNFKQLTPDFGRNLNAVSDDWAPMSVLWFDQGASAFHTTFDRFFLELNKGKWNIRAGRQRVNWGINLSFNPNDIFNAFNFLDFDYEERPGVDAVRVQYYYNSFSGIDFVVKGGDHIRNAGAGMRWFFNTKGFDFQVLSGLSNGDFSVGTGWAGFLGSTGWKGEISYFIPIEEDQGKNVLSASTGVDYSFGSGWFVYGAYLYSGNDAENVINPLGRNGRLTAKNLYPYQHNFLSQLSYTLSPVVSASTSLVYSIHDSHPLLFSPGLQINLSERWDLDIIGQHFIPLKKVDQSGDIHLLFLRIKMSY